MQANLAKTAGRAGKSLDFFHSILYNESEKFSGRTPGGGRAAAMMREEREDV